MSYPVINCSGVPFSALPASAWGTLSGSAVYMFCRRERDRSITILYIGECENLLTRVGPRHEKWEAAARLGMNELHVHLLAQTRRARLDVETRLRWTYVTPLNEQQSDARQGLGLLGALAPAPFGGAPPLNALAPFTSDPPPVNSLLALAPMRR